MSWEYNWTDWQAMADVVFNVGKKTSANNKKRFFQYLFIYCVLLTGNSYLYSYFIEPFTTLIALLLIATVFLIPRLWHFRDVVFTVFVLVLSLIVRCFAGGVGISTFMRFAMTITLIDIAIKVDEGMFLTRLLRVVCFLTVISSAAYFARLLYPSLYQVLPLYEFASQGVYYSMQVGTHLSYHTKGLFLICMREDEIRNIGIFTEPGLYQGVLTAVLFGMLFMSNKFQYSKHEQTFSLIVLLVGIATCGSTTGFLSTIGVLAFFALSIGRREAFASRLRLKRTLSLTAVILLVGLAVDYYIRADQSILSVSFFNKLFVDTTNGEVRADSVNVSLKMLLQYPFGVGFDTIQNAKGALSVGAGLFVTTAALGIPFPVAYLYWLLAPILKSDLGFWGICAFIFIYFNFAFSQSLILTPVLVSISIYYALTGEGAKRDEDSLALQYTR